MVVFSTDSIMMDLPQGVLVTVRSGRTRYGNARHKRPRRCAEHGHEFPSLDMDCHATLRGVTRDATAGTIPPFERVVCDCFTLLRRVRLSSKTLRDCGHPDIHTSCQLQT